MCCIVDFLTLLIMSGCKGEEINDKDAQKIYELNLSCIHTEEKSIEMKNETKGAAKIKVTYPDYKALFLEASNQKIYSSILIRYF